MVEFSHHLGDLDYKDLFIQPWDIAQFLFIPCLQESELIMYILVDTHIAPCYMYVHEETHTSNRALEQVSLLGSVSDGLSLRNWHLIEDTWTQVTPHLSQPQRWPVLLLLQPLGLRSRHESTLMECSRTR